MLAPSTSKQGFELDLGSHDTWYMTFPAVSWPQGTVSPEGPCLAPLELFLSTWPMAQHPMPTHQGHQPLPQQHCSRAGLQLPTALPCPAMDPTKPGPYVGPSHSPVLSLPIPRMVPDAQG